MRPNGRDVRVPGADVAGLSLPGSTDTTAYREYVCQLVNEWPPLTAGQRDKLALLLRTSPSREVAA